MSSPTTLSHLGFDTYWHQRFHENSSPGEPGRVTAVYRGSSDIATEHGTLRAHTGHLDVCTGDWVRIDTQPTGGAVLTTVLPRRTAIVRASAGATSHTQTLAANVDTVVVTVAADTELDLGRVERYVALAWDSGATPLVVLTKCDTGDSNRVTDLKASSPGVTVLAISSRSGDGIPCLTEHLAGTIALIGPSGSGKSTLANTLVGQEVLSTGDVREADGKGRHVTVRRELVPLPTAGMTVIDTPGLRSVGLVASEVGLQQTFSDIEDASARCRFRDCTHRSEPGCAVQEGIDPRRIANYHRLQRENHWATTRHDARANEQRLAEAKQLAKLQRRMYKSRGR